MAGHFGQDIGPKCGLLGSCPAKVWWVPGCVLQLQQQLRNMSTGDTVASFNFSFSNNFIFSSHKGTVSDSAERRTPFVRATQKRSPPPWQIINTLETLLLIIWLTYIRNDKSDNCRLAWLALLIIRKFYILITNYAIWQKTETETNMAYTRVVKHMTRGPKPAACSVQSAYWMLKVKKKKPCMLVMLCRKTKGKNMYCTR